MTIMAHPNPENVQRYRVLDRSLGVQDYFSITQHGPDKAYRLAKEREEEIKNRRYIRSLRMKMDINKLFTEGQLSAKGLRRYYREDRDTLMFRIQLTVDGVQKGAEVSLNNRTFLEAYSLVQKKMCELHGIVLDYEIRKIFSALSYLYK